MKKRKLLWVALGVLALAVPASLGIHRGRVRAADHLDPPARQNMTGGMATPGNTADIADVYAWHQGTGASATLVTILTFGGPLMPAANQRMPCDRDVLYTIHISNDMDNEPEIDIRTRFGTDAMGNCGVQIENVPGAGGNIVGRTEMTLQGGMSRAFAGLRDDAFFFDLQGFRETVAMGTLRFVNDRDFFAGQNTPAIAIEMPLSAVMGSAPNIRVWATTARIGM